MTRSDQTLVHFYRAVVSHMDVWRQRMDATTNWAAATSAVMITFAFSTPRSPHFVLLIAMAFQMVFLIMESRRYQVYDLWRRRFRTLNRHMIAPALRASDVQDDESRERLAELALDLGRTVPHLGFADAIGYRLRRNYGYLLGVTLGAWALNLEVQPEPTGSLDVLLERASVGSLPGTVIVPGVLLMTIGLVVLTMRAPSEQMLGWNEVPAPFRRWRWRAPGGGDGDENPGPEGVR